ncbi:MAG: Trk system potassium transporter TrkA [Proteobacteria bacterium]|nr:Trk system potassium transporter TrkA [Pseudomonadota bacterium]
MKILIIGAGETGFYIASEFSEDNFEVTVVDENPNQLKVIQRSLNVAGIRGNGTTLSVLESAGIESADLVVASTDHDETNLISCLLAHHYNIKHTIAVTKTESFMKKKLIAEYVKSGISQIINSTMVTAQEIVDTANLASATEVSAFGEKNVLLVGYRVKKDSPWKDLYLKDIRQQSEESRFLIASIVRDGQSSIPSGQDQIKQGDYVYVLIPRQIANDLNQILKVKISSNRKAVIAGENLIAERVAASLLKSHYAVTMICGDELSLGRMKKKFGHRKRFTVIQGNGEEVKVQLKADVAVSSLFIAVSNDDHLNIAAGMVAHYLGATKTICLVNRQDLIHSAESVDIDVIISPRLVTARQVKKTIRGGEESLSYTTISETNMEVLEMIAAEDSTILGIPLKDIKLPKNSLVGALIKDKNQVIIPTGETTIEAGNKVVMVALPECVPKLRELLEGKNGKAAVGMGT